MKQTDFHPLQLAGVSCNNFAHLITMRLSAPGIPRLFLLLIFFFSAISSQAPATEQTTKTQDLITKSAAIAQSFTKDINLTGFKKNAGKARALLIIPKLQKIGFIAGATGGTGVLLSHDIKNGKWSYPVFYTMGSISLDIHFGSDTSEIILMVMTLKGLKALLNAQCKLGTDVTFAAGSMASAPDAGSEKTDILYFRRSLDASDYFSIDDSIIAPRSAWNKEYYGKYIDPADVLLRNSVVNPQAEVLRQALSAAK